jgi:hypothetical protein
MEQVRSVQRNLERILGEPMVLDDQIQDATYFAQLAIVDEIETATGPNRLARISIEFSNFGSLATISNPNFRATKDEMDVAAATLKEHAFVCIPDAALDEPYDGKLPGFRNFNGGPATWRDRYFNYT